MKTILKIAMAAGIAGALVNMLMKRRARNRGDQPDEFLGKHARPRTSSAEFSAEEVVADTNGISSGDATRDQRSPQPQDWRGAQNVLDS